MSEELFEDIERSQQYAEEMDQIQLVGMKLGEEEYAIDVLKITEIIRTVEITIVPRMESYILGVMNLRGKVVPVIDLRVRFNLDSCDFDKSTRIIVVSVNKENIGFVVDEVTEVIRIKRSMVEPTPPLVGSIGQEYILGICKYDSRLIMLLDIDRVIDESGRYHDSELRKKMLGTTKTVTKLAPMPEPVAAPEPAAEAAPAPAPSPAFDNISISTDIVDARCSAEYITPTFLPCILIGLNNAPLINSTGGITIERLDFLLMPYNALGSIPVFEAQKRNIPIYAVLENKTLLNVTNDKIHGKCGIVYTYEEFLEGLE